MGTLGKHWKLTEKTKQKMRKPKGIRSEQHKKNLGLALLGKNKGKKKPPMTSEHKAKLAMTMFKKGQIPWNKGELGIVGGNNGLWKGDKVSYGGLHQWVSRQLGKPNNCEKCGKIGYGRKMHWANKSHQYKRELSDWIRLCVSCHKKYDNIQVDA